MPDTAGCVLRGRHSPSPFCVVDAALPPFFSANLICTLSSPLGSTSFYAMRCSHALNRADAFTPPPPASPPPKPQDILRKSSVQETLTETKQRRPSNKQSRAKATTSLQSRSSTDIFSVIAEAIQGNILHAQLLP